MKSLCSLILCFLVILVSCNNIDEFGENQTNITLKTVKLSKEEYVSISNDNLAELSEYEVYRLVDNFILLFKGKQRSLSNTNLTIQDKYYINLDKEGRQTKSVSINNNQLSIPIYKVSIEGDNNTSVYVSADSRFANVIAYIPNDGKEKEVQTGKSIMLDITEAITLKNVEYTEKLKDSLREQTLEKISKELSVNQNNIEFKNVKSQLIIEANSLASKSSPISYPDGLYPTYSGVKTIAQWEQREPYNSKLPNLPLFPTMHYPAGCGVIAIATLFSCVQPNLTAYNTTIDWNYLLWKQHVEIADLDKRIDMISNLIKHIYYGTETNTTFEGGNSMLGQSETEPSKILSYLRKYINIGDMENLNVEKIYKALFLNNQPSLIGGYRDGGAHGWIVDGCVTVIDKNATGSVRPSCLYIHCNMGWGGTDDGYYLVSSSYTLTFDTQLGSYNRDIWQLCGGRRK